MELISLSMSLHRTIWNDMRASSPHASNLAYMYDIYMYRYIKPLQYKRR